MTIKRNWTQATVFVVLALTSLSSIALAAPYRDGLAAYTAPPADVCGESSRVCLQEYFFALAAMEQSWVTVPAHTSASFTDPFEQYLLATTAAVSSGENSQSHLERHYATLAASEQTWITAPVRTNEGGPDAFEQYLSATTVPTVGSGESSRAHLEQHYAALAASERAWVAASDYADQSRWDPFAQYLSATTTTGQQ